MSVTAELAKNTHRMEYVLCIEGVGWPTDFTDLSSNFDGDVFTTNDFDGDLATKLDCTVHHGLSIPSSITDSVDPRTAQYDMGGMTFEITDVDGWWLANFTPGKTGTEQTLNGAVDYKSTTIIMTNGAAFSQNDLVWVGGRELVKLGSKSTHTFTGCTRGFLGTPRGSVLRQPGTAMQFDWPDDTSIYTINRFWTNRKASLWGHVPGEAPHSGSADNMLLLWAGKISGVSVSDMGVKYMVQCNGDWLTTIGRTKKAVDWRASQTQVFISRRRRTSGVNSGGLPNDSYRIWQMHQPYHDYFEGESVPGGKYQLAAFYRYRTEDGGTEGMVTTWDAAGVQALDTSFDNDVIMRYARFGEEILLVKKKYDDPVTGDAGDRFKVMTELISSLGSDRKDLDEDEYGFKAFDDLTPVRFLLDNWQDAHEYNHFAVNKIVTRNPIDLLLSFLTSMDHEFFIADCTAGSTATVVNFTAAGAADLWIGKALFAVQGTNNKGEARVISDSTTTSITVENGFTDAPTTGDNFHVRNSIYDTLPLGWGLGIDSALIDIDSFETLRDCYYPNAKIGKFVIGMQDEVNVWELIKENILEPYGILVRFDRTTRKIKATYLGQPSPDGVLETYQAIAKEDIVSLGDINYEFHNPIGAINLEVRQTERRIIDAYQPRVGEITNRRFATLPAVGFDSATDKINVRSSEIEAAFADDGRDEIGFRAMFNTRSDAAPLIARNVGLISQYTIQPPVVDVTLTLEKYPNLFVGGWITLTYASVPPNTFSGQRGWSSQVGRVLGLQLLPSQTEPTFVATVELYNTIVIGKVAPAATITARDQADDYFTVNDSDFIPQRDTSKDKDWYHFVVGDLVSWRNSDGTVVENHVIESFGSNEVADPTTATGSRINVTGAVGATAVATGDYLTFTDWSNSNTARMDQFSAYADANGNLTGDSARVYG